MAGKDSQPGLREAALLRRRRSVELRIGGNSYRAIAQATGVNVKQAFEDVRRGLEESAPPPDPAQVAAYRLLQDERLQFLFRRVAPLIDRETPDLTAVARAVQIEARRAALWGLDAPAQVDLRLLIEQEAETIAAQTGLVKQDVVNEVYALMGARPK